MTEESYKSIFTEGCLVNMSISVWGGRIKLPSRLLELKDVDPRFIKASKDLIEKDYLKPINDIRNEATTYLYNKSLPFPIRGINFAPKGMIQEIDERLKEFRNIFNARTDSFIDQFTEIRDQARSYLGKYWDEDDYPENIRAKFGFSWRFFIMDSPNGKSLITPEMVAEEQEKFIQTINSFKVMAINSLRTRFAELVDHLVERLNGKNDGKKKIFRNSVIDNFKPFLEDFEKLNINDDQELARLVEQCQEILNGIRPEELRTSEGFRDAIRSSMEQVQNQMDYWLIDRPARAITKLKKEE
jgi:hypothetical protein